MDLNFKGNKMIKTIIKYIKSLFSTNENIKPERKKYKRLTPKEIEEIKHLLSSGSTGRSIASIYDVSESTISKIKKEL